MLCSEKAYNTLAFVSSELLLAHSTLHGQIKGARRDCAAYFSTFAQQEPVNDPLFLSVITTYMAEYALPLQPSMY